MKIGNKMRIVMALPITLGVIFCAMILWTLRISEHSLEQDVLFENMVQDAFQLSLLTHEVSLHPLEQRARKQWNLKHASLEIVLREIFQNNSDAGERLKRLEQNHGELQELFNKLTTIIDPQTNRDIGREVNEERRNRVVSRMTIKAQALVFDAFSLAEYNRNTILVLGRRIVLSIIFLTTIAASLLAVLSYLISRSILVPLTSLHKGTEIIGSGNLEHTVGTSASDEIGQLSRAFDQMVGHLKSTMASRDDLNREIAEHERTERALRESETKYRNLFDNIPQKVFYKDANSVYLAVNPSYANSFDLKPDDFINKTDLDFFPEELAKQYQSDDHEIMEHGEITDYDEEYVVAGERWTAHTVKVPTYDDEGNLSGILSILWDITERKLFEDTLRCSLALSQEIGRLTEEDVMNSILDEGVRVTSSKLGFFHFVDVDKQIVILKTWTGEVMKECTVADKTSDYPISEAGIWIECIKEAKPVIHNDYANAPNRKGLPEGHVLVVRDLEVPVIEDGKVVAIIGVGNKEKEYEQSDVNRLSFLAGNGWSIIKRIRAENSLKAHAFELERLNDELEIRNTELNEFTYIASHDLQEPLRKITAFSGLLKKDLGGALSDDAGENLDFLADAASRMQTLVNDLLVLSRSGRRELEREFIPLDDCVDLALDALSISVEETGAQIDRDDLPEVWGDKMLLTQLYQNLLGNALKFVSDIAPKVNLSAQLCDEEWVLGVKDNGIGIDQQYAEQIFTPFKRLHGRTEYPGTGIGLAMCRKAVERHGGRIWVESDPGKGSHFKFTISKRKEIR